MDQKETSEKCDAPMDSFSSELGRVVHETRGLLGILKSVKGLAPRSKEDKLYRITLKRFHDNCIRLASYAVACSLIRGDEERDRLLSGLGCRWDQEKSRVSLD